MMTGLWTLLGDFPGHRLLTYISFRALAAMMAAFLLGLLLGRPLIALIDQLNLRDKSRKYGDISGQHKDGTPTMGGLIIFTAFVSSLLLWADLRSLYVQLIILAGFWFTALGMVDDTLKKIRGSSDAGLGRGAKLILQALYGGTLALVVLSPASTPFPEALIHHLYLPFVKHPLTLPAWVYFILIVLAVIAISNSINFADGMDGLATVPSALVAAVYGVFAYVLGNARIPSGS